MNNGIFLREGLDHIDSHPQYNADVLEALGNISTNLTDKQVARQVQDVATTLRIAIVKRSYGPWG